MPTTYPIILAHGICPFDKMMNPVFHKDNHIHDRFHYFRNIRSTLIKHGYTVYHSRVSWANSLQKRAQDLKNEILRISRGFKKWPKVHIIAHSMGGLDSRWMIYRYQMDDRVATLTTIGTPHHGSSLADVRLIRFNWLISTAGFFGVNITGFRNLTTEFCREMNAQIKEFESNNRVLYQTIAGAQPQDRISLFLKTPFKIILDREGENDGLVSLTSAMWKKEYLIRQIDADHFNQIGWWNKGEGKAGMNKQTFEQRIQSVYLDIAAALHD